MSNYITTILRDSPIVYYRLDESSGTSANDISGNTYTGTLNGGITLGQTGALFSDTNKAMLFDGSTGYISLPSALNGNGFTALTFEGWYKPSTSALGSFTLLMMGDNTDHNFGYQLYWSGTSSLNFNVGVGTANNGVSYNASPVANVYWHIVGTFDGSTIRLYVNGVLQGSASLSGTISASATPILGASTGHSFKFPGTIDEVAIYSYALSALQVSTHYTTGISGNIASFSIQDAAIYKSQVVKAYSSSGVFIDTVKDAPYLTGFTESLNGATSSLKVSLPRSIDAYDGTNMPGSKQTIVQGNILKWYLYGPGLPSTGLLRYQGIIDTIRPHLDESGGEAVELTVTPYSQILGDHGIIGPIAYGTAGNPGTYVDSGVMFSSLFTTQVDSITGHPYGYPFTLDGSNPATTGNTAANLLQNQTVASALTTILLLSPSNYYFRPNTDISMTFNQYDLTTATHTLKIGQHIALMEYALDNVPRKNVIVVQGNGVQATAIGASVTQIGQRVHFKADNRITDTHTAQLLANGLLSFYDRPQIRTKIKVPDYRGDALFGMGYDIEKFKVGQTIKVLDTRSTPSAVNNPSSTWGGFIWGSGYWGATPANLAIWGLFKWGQTTWGYNVGGVFNTILPIVAVDYAWNYVTLEVGARQPSMLRSLYLLESRFLDTSMVS